MGAIDPSKRATKRGETINLRVSSADLNLIDNAAAAAGKSRSEFMLECARQHAVDQILDQRLFRLEVAAFDAFVKALDEPAAPNKALKALFARKPVWER